MAYKIIKMRHYFGNKFIYRVVNTSGKGVHMFGVNKNFGTAKEAAEHMRKASYSRNF